MIYSLFLLLILVDYPPVVQDSTLFYTDQGQVEFISSVPLHEFSGTSADLTGMIDFEENIVDFYLDLNTLKTGNSRRDRDMYRTLHVEDYPFVEFTGELVTSFDMNSPEKQQAVVTGEFTINGITREKTVEGVLQVQDGHISLEAEWIQDITDHDIEPPGILFYRVRDEMDVRIEALLQPNHEINEQNDAVRP